MVTTLCYREGVSLESSLAHWAYACWFFLRRPVSLIQMRYKGDFFRLYSSCASFARMDLRLLISCSIRRVYISLAKGVEFAYVSKISLYGQERDIQGRVPVPPVK